MTLHDGLETLPSGCFGPEYHEDLALDGIELAHANRSTRRWKICGGAGNADTLINFAKRVTQDGGAHGDTGRNAHLILDNPKVHHSKPVEAWLDEHEREIEVFYLERSR